MPATDYRGSAVSGATPRALELYERALASLWLQRGSALELAREAAREAPAFVAAQLLVAALLASSRDVRQFRLAGAALEPVRRQVRNPREAAHEAAIASAIAGDYAASLGQYEAILREDPRDVVALHVSAVMDYYLGAPQATRDRVGRAIRHWTPDLPGFHAALSMHAFALEECGEYGAAHEVAARALAIEPLDLRAHHAIAHVLEMQGQGAEGIRWMGSRSTLWDGAGPASTHLWWHLALYQQQLGRPDLALMVYDRRFRHEGLAQLIDASALLWRLHLDGADAGARFEALAERWAPHAEDAYCTFNDLHAMMAFAGARRTDLAQRLLAAQERRLRSGSHDITRLVGLPACRALLEFSRGEHAVAERLLRALPPVAHRIGGSHAQRDVLQLTRAAALQLEARRKSNVYLFDPSTKGGSKWKQARSISTASDTRSASKSRSASAGT